MKLQELKNKKAQLIKKQITASGGSKPKVYILSTGTTVIYSIGSGGEHISISNHERMPTIEEMEFVKNKLMKKDIIVKMIFPRATNHMNVVTYTGHILEVEKNVMYN